MDFKQRSFPSVMATTIALGVLMSAVTASAQSASTFQQSCNNIKYGVDKAGTPIVLASCLKADSKTRVETAAALRGFENKDGRLTAGPGPSTFQKTCKDMKVEPRDGHIRLDATCQKTSGQWVKTSTILYDVNNKDGQLHHRVPGNDKVVR